MRLTACPLILALLSSAALATDFTDTDVKTWAPEIIDGRFLKEFKGQAVSMTASLLGENGRRDWGYSDLDPTVTGVIKSMFLGPDSKYKHLMMVCETPQGLAELTAEENRREPLRTIGLAMMATVSGTVAGVELKEDSSKGYIRITLEPGCAIHFDIPTLSAEQEAALPELQLPNYLASALEDLEQKHVYVRKTWLQTLYDAILLDQSITQDEFELLLRLHQGDADFRVTNSETGASFVYRNYVAKTSANELTKFLTDEGQAVSEDVARYLWSDSQANLQHLLAVARNDDGYKALTWHNAGPVGAQYRATYDPDTKEWLSKYYMGKRVAFERALTEQADKDLLRNLIVDVLHQSNFMRADGTEAMPDYAFRFLRPVDSDRAKAERDRGMKELPMEPLVRLEDMQRNELLVVKLPVATYSMIKLREKGANQIKSEVEEVELWNALYKDKQIDAEEYKLLRALFEQRIGVTIVANDRPESSHPPYTYHFNFNKNMKVFGWGMPDYTKSRLIRSLIADNTFRQLDPPMPSFEIDNQLFNYLSGVNDHLIKQLQLIPWNIADTVRKHIGSNTAIYPNWRDIYKVMVGPDPFIRFTSRHDGQEYELIFINFWAEQAKRDFRGN